MNFESHCSITALDVDLGLLFVGVINDRTREFLSCFRQASINKHFQSALFTKFRAASEVRLYTDDAEKLKVAGFIRHAELLLLGIIFLDLSTQETIIKLAEIYESEEAYPKTIQLTQGLIQRGAQDPEVLYQQSFALFRLGRADEALEAILPLFICDPAPKTSRLCGLILQALGYLEDSIDVLTRTIEQNPTDVHSIRALSQIYLFIGSYNESLRLLRSMPKEGIVDGDKLCEALVYRFMGELDLAISNNSDILADNPEFADAIWTQCFNYSIAGFTYSTGLLDLSRRFWEYVTPVSPSASKNTVPSRSAKDLKLRVGFLSSDIGEHVVSRFMMPILRNYDKTRYHVVIFSTARRFEHKGSEIIEFVDDAISLQGLSQVDAFSCIESYCLDIVIETNGFTAGSGLPILANRCSPVQCHYIGYHATTGLKSIDYFLGDSITAPPDFQSQFTEKLVQIPSLWMAYDSSIEFPAAISTSQVQYLVMGAFSQVAKINHITLEYWAAAMNLVPDSVLVIKDRGLQCETTRKRIQETLSDRGIDSNRVYFFGPVVSQLDHLDAYNAIDIALDTTPWSGATTAFEALGMGVPLVAICGDTISGRMSTSVVSAAGMGDLIANTVDEFAGIVSNLAKDYKQIRSNKLSMQNKIRSSILFDEVRICNDFFATIERLVSKSHDNFQST